MIGTISRVDVSLYKDTVFFVDQFNGNRLGYGGWSENAFDFYHAPIRTRDMTPEDRVAGTKVICVYGPIPAYTGKIGHIRVAFQDGSYSVESLDGDPISNSWSYMSSFKVIIDEPAEVVVAEPVKEEVFEIVSRGSKPCPSYYYGPSACTCGNCSTRKMVFR